MPNAKNITAPILLVGAGRTASSYVLEILKLRGDIQPLVENTIVMDIKTMLLSSWWSNNWIHVYNDRELIDAVVRTTRNVMIDLFPSSKSKWAYKAIWEEIDWDWYQQVYPDAKYIHLVRDPRTNIMSMMDYIAKDHNNQHWTFEYCCKKYIASNNKALDLRSRRVPYFRVKQEDFVDDPAETWRRIYEFAGLEYIESVFSIEVNTSSQTGGKVKEKRANSAVSWNILPKEVIEIANRLGYFPKDGYQREKTK